MIHYYKARTSLGLDIHAMIKAANKEQAKAKKLAKELGAKECGYRDTWLSVHLVGFKFDVPPDKVDWKQIKGSTWWCPRLSTKSGKEIKAQMDAIKPFSAAQVAKLIGMQVFKGVELRNPGLHQVGDAIYLSVPDDVVPKGCDRVSDIDFEAAVATAKNRRKR